QQQFVAYRRVDPSLCNARLTFNDLLELALSGDYEFLSGLVQAFEREQASVENLSFISLGLTQRFAATGRRVYPLIDCLAFTGAHEEHTLAQALTGTLEEAGLPFVLVGLRRQVGKLIHGLDQAGDAGHTVIHVNRLADGDAARVADAVAHRYAIEINDATRDQ